MKTFDLTLIGALLLATAGTAAAQTDIATCGQTVTGSARLVADLNCVEADEFAVRILKGDLDLNGHTISGFDGVSCDRPCTVTGPGTIMGTIGSTAIGGATRVTVVGVDISNCQFGVVANGSVSVVNSTVTDSTHEGIRSNRKATVTGSTVTGNSWAVRADRAKIDSSTITGNASGVLVARKLHASLSTIIDNGEFDIESNLRPNLESTDCGTSFHWNSTETWGVCSLD
jgi:hypothetical protein